MGVKVAPDFAQKVMESILSDLESFEVFIKNVGVFSKSSDDHMRHLTTSFTHIQDNGFTVNPLKCEWEVKETYWLSYWLTPTGLKPWYNKVSAI